jgi:predicted TIM-barrel fold metal-dependent hydrolase
VHSSANWTRSRPSDLGHPRHLDAVACAFPDTPLIMSHAGYPWVLEACLLTWKHPNLYLELGAHRPRYFATPGTGWEPLLRYGTTTIADKICYGSGAFLINRPPSVLVGEMYELGLEQDVPEKWLWRNSARLLHLPRPVDGLSDRSGTSGSARA